MTRSTLVSVARLALVTICVAGLAPVPASAEARVSVDSLSNTATYRVVARGYKDGEELATWFTGPQGQVAPGRYEQADEKGRSVFQFLIPRHFQPGVWAITVYGLESNREAIESFDVSTQEPNAQLVAEPPSGPAGTTFVFDGGGFDADELVSYWLTGPEGEAYPGGVTQSTGSGTVRFEYPIGAETRPGVALSTTGASGTESRNGPVIS